MVAIPQIVSIVEEEGKAGILKPGDVEIRSEDVEALLVDFPSGSSEADRLRALLPLLVAPYKRVLLSASHIHARRRHKGEEWDSHAHLDECLRQHRHYFKRRGVATSLDIEPQVAFGDKGVTGTANDRDVFLAFMRRIGLEDAVSPNAIAAAVMKGLREHPSMKWLPEEVLGKLFEAMAKRPGQNVDRSVFDAIISSTPMKEDANHAYEILCELTRKRYDAINQAIMRAHAMLQVSLTLEKEGIARFTIDNPFGLAIPYERSLFRVYELDDTHHVARVCPTFFTAMGGTEEGEHVEIVPVSHGSFEELDGVERFRIGEIYVPATVEQLSRVGQFALEHCNFDMAVLNVDAEQALGNVLDGSGGMIRKMSLDEVRKTRRVDRRLIMGEESSD